MVAVGASFFEDIMLYSLNSSSSSSDWDFATLFTPFLTPLVSFYSNIGFKAGLVMLELTLKRFYFYSVFEYEFRLRAADCKYFMHFCDYPLL